MNVHALIGPLPTRKEIFSLQDFLEKSVDAGDAVQADCPLIHEFSRGMYSRSILIPGGSMLVGKTHRHNHLLIQSVGECYIVTDTTREHLVGFQIRDSGAGVKRCVYAVVDTIITTIHLSDTADLVAIEKDVIIADTDVPAEIKQECTA